MTIHSLYTIKDFCHTGSKTLSFSVGQQFASSIQADEMCQPQFFCIAVCSKSRVRFCTVNNGVLAQRRFPTFMPHRREGGGVNVQNASMVKWGQTCCSKNQRWQV